MSLKIGPKIQIQIPPIPPCPPPPPSSPPYPPYPLPVPCRPKFEPPQQGCRLWASPTLGARDIVLLHSVTVC